MDPQNQSSTPSAPEQPTQAPKAPDTGGKGYGKLSKGKWIAIYVAAGAIIYFLIYWFFLRASY